MKAILIDQFIAVSTYIKNKTGKIRKNHTQKNGGQEITKTQMWEQQLLRETNKTTKTAKNQQINIVDIVDFFFWENAITLENPYPEKI